MRIPLQDVSPRVEVSGWTSGTLVGSCMGCGSFAQVKRIRLSGIESRVCRNCADKVRRELGK